MRLGKTFYARNRTEWRRWLARHHTTESEIFLIYYKKHTGKPRVAYNDAVEEALCYGWIDSVLKPLDADRYAQRYSPRRPTSRLSTMNHERVRRLIKSRKMTRAGLASLAHVFDVKKDTAKRVKWAVPQDILKRLQRDAAVWENFQRFSDSYKRIRIGWIDAARHRPEAFETRLRYFFKMTKQDKRFGMVQ